MTLVPVLSIAQASPAKPHSCRSQPSKYLSVAKHSFPHRINPLLQVREGFFLFLVQHTADTMDDYQAPFPKPQHPFFFCIRLHLFSLSLLLHPFSFVLTNIHLSSASLFIDNTPLLSAAVVFPSLPQRRQDLPPRTFGFVPATEVIKNSSARTASVNNARWRRAP